MEFQKIYQRSQARQIWIVRLEKRATVSCTSDFGVFVLRLGMKFVVSESTMKRNKPTARYLHWLADHGYWWRTEMQVEFVKA